jgi:hypothetical protein
VHPNLTARLVLFAANATLIAGCAVAGDDPAIAELPDDVLVQASANVVPLGCSLPGPSGIANYNGFVGSYVRLGTAADGEVVTLNIRTIGSRPQSIAMIGNWDGLVQRGQLIGSEHGTYDAIPDNPAAGPFLVLHATTRDDFYQVIGSHKNLFGRIDKLCIVNANSEVVHEPFGLQRNGF